MNTASNGQEKKCGDTGEDTLKLPASNSRRLLLAGAAGGMVLAASGLFLPAWVDEAAAAQHPAEGVQRRKAKRRGKRHNQRRRHRDHSRRKHNQSDSPRGRHSELDIAFLVENHRSSEIVVWGEVSDYGNWRRWFGRDFIQAGQTPYYASDDFEARIHIGFDGSNPTSVDVYANNPPLGWPSVTVEAWNRQSTIHQVFFKRYSENEEGSVDVIAWDQRTPIHLDIKRLEDDNTTKHKRFRVIVS